MEGNKFVDGEVGGYEKWAKYEKHCNYLWTLKNPKSVRKFSGNEF